MGFGKQHSHNIVLDPLGGVDVIPHRAVMRPAALAFDGFKRRARTMRTGGQAAAQAVTAQLRHTVQPRSVGYRFQNEPDAGQVQLGRLELTPVRDPPNNRPVLCVFLTLIVNQQVGDACVLAVAS